MTKILIVPSTVQAGARRCHTVAREASAASRRVASMPSPEGMPPEAVGQLRAAAAQLGRSAASAQSEAAFLSARARLGLLADGPFGLPMDLLGPGLLSPWAPLPEPPKPEKKKKHHFYDGAVDYLDGAKDEVVETGVGLGRTGAGLAGHVIDGDLPLPLPGFYRPGQPKISQHIPIIGDQKRQLDEGVDWAKKHPGEFAKAIGKDLTAYDDHAKGDHAHGAGRNTVGILSLLVPATKAASAAKASKAASAAARAEKTAGEVNAASRAARNTARAEHQSNVAGGRRPGESAAEFAARLRTSRWNATMATGRARLADNRLETEVQRAQDAARHAATARHDALVEAGRTAKDSARDTTAKALTQDHKDGT